MKCRKNYTKNNNNKSIMFFASKGVDEVGHAIFDDLNNHQRYVITFITQAGIPTDVSKAKFDVAYYDPTAVGMILYFKVKGEDKLLSSQELKEKFKNILFFDNVDTLRKFLDKVRPNDSYSSDQEAIADSLIQKLSIIKRELWYKMSYGLPLFDKIKNKGFIDIVALQIISSHPSINNVISFQSYMTNPHEYNCEFSVTTNFTTEKEETKLKLSISNY